MNTLKIAQPPGVNQRPAVLVIAQRPPAGYAPGGGWARSPAALKAWAVSNGYTLAGKRQGRAAA